MNDNRVGFLGGPDYVSSSQLGGDVELVFSSGGIQATGALAQGPYPFDPASPNVGTIRVPQASDWWNSQPASSGGSGGLLLLIFVLWLVFK